MEISRVSNDDVHAALNGDDVNLDSQTYTHFITSAHYHTNRLQAQYPGMFFDEDLLVLIEVRLAAHYYLEANPIVKELKGDDHAFKLNVSTPVVGILGSNFGREANMLSGGRLLQMQKTEVMQDAFLFAGWITH